MFLHIQNFNAPVCQYYLRKRHHCICFWTFASHWPEIIHTHQDSSVVFSADMALNAKWNHTGPLCHNPTLNHDTWGGRPLPICAHNYIFWMPKKQCWFFLFIMRCTALGVGRDWKTDASVHYRGKHTNMSECWLAAFGLSHVVSVFGFGLHVMWFSKNQLSTQKKIRSTGDLI